MVTDLIKPTFITASKTFIFIFQVPTLTLVAKDKEQKKMWMEVTLKNTKVVYFFFYFDLQTPVCPVVDE